MFYLFLPLLFELILFRIRFFLIKKKNYWNAMARWTPVVEKLGLHGSFELSQHAASLRASSGWFRSAGVAKQVQIGRGGVECVQLTTGTFCPNTAVLTFCGCSSTLLQTTT